jgi:hypothetical protein
MGNWLSKQRHMSFLPSISELGTDVLYSDDDITILHPQSKRGIVVYSDVGSTDVITEGLKTGECLFRTNPEQLKRNVQHPYSFFRAPHVSNSEGHPWVSYYDDTIVPHLMKGTLVTLRIDPSHTRVYSSECRTRDIPVILSRCDMKTYYQRIGAVLPHKNGYEIVYIIVDGTPAYCSTARYSRLDNDPSPCYMKYPYRYNCEILCRMPTIPPDWMVDIVHKNEYLKQSGKYLPKYDNFVANIN